MKLKTGKRYVRRDGRVTGELIKPLFHIPPFKFMDPDTGATYKSNGCWDLCDSESPLDLVREHRED